jgi:hypothetical protein
VAVEVSLWANVWSMENGSWGAIGCGGEVGCSWVLYIGRGRLARAAEERSQWRLVEFNGIAVLSLESTPRGRGNGGAAPLWKGKWRRCGLGHGGGARHDGSRPDGRWWRGIGPDEGDEGGAGRVGCRGRGGRVGRMPVGPARRENKEESGMGHKDDWAEMILGCAEKKKKVFGF